MSDLQNLIKRLEDDEQYVDAVDDAIAMLNQQAAEIERLKKRIAELEGAIESTTKALK